MSDRVNMKSLYNRYSEKLRNFLLTSKSREFLLFLFFLFISASFWLLQTLNEPYETEISIPLRLENIPEDAVITEEPPSEIKVTVRDKGTILMTYQLGKSLLPITLNFNKYRTNGSHVKIPASTLEKLVASRLSGSTKLLAVKPSVVEYYYSIGERRMLPVKLHLKVNTRMEYVATDTLMKPDSVLVFAPMSILNGMKFVDTETAVFDNIADTVSLSVPLYPVKGAKFVPSAVRVTIPVDLLTEKTVEVPVYGVGFPQGKMLRTFPSRVKVRFLVAFHRFQQIRPEDFMIQIPYSELESNKFSKCRLRVTSAPKEVSHVRVEPEFVDFLIEETKNVR